MRRRSQLLLGVILAAVLMSAAALLPLALMFLPEHHGDMMARLDSLPFPPQYTLIGRGVGGARSGLSAPHADVQFAVPADLDAICPELEALVASARSPGDTVILRSRTSARCSYGASIAAGWRARVVGIWRYRLSVSAMTRERALRSVDEEGCRGSRRARQQHSDNLYFGSPRCWLAPGHSLVEVTAIGGQGLFVW